MFELFTNQNGKKRSGVRFTKKFTIKIIVSQYHPFKLYYLVRTVAYSEYIRRSTLDKLILLHFGQLFQKLLINPHFHLR